MREVQGALVLFTLLAMHVAVQLATTGSAFATDAIPNCPAYRLRNQNGGDPGSLGVNNDQVLEWKAHTANTFTARGHVTGRVVKIYPDRNGHEHFAIQIGPRADDTVEIVYNQHFGPVPEPRIGMPVEACGDYITSTAPSPGPNGQVYPASPDKALIHWLHFAPRRSGHHSGYLMINGVLTGQGFQNGLGRSDDGNPPRIDFYTR